MKNYININKANLIDELRDHWRLATAIAVVIVATIAIYSPGLHGPFLLDDLGNLEPLNRWFNDELSWQAVVFDNRSGPSGRPLSMLSFVIDVVRTGKLDSFTFKQTNLAIHLASGLAVLALTREILLAQRWSRPYRHWIPVAVMALWLWMPIQVSTVLYVIQRMAQLSAFWTLATLTAYLYARRQIACESSWKNLALLWVLVPLLATLATLSKENGALALPLVAVAELTLFAAFARIQHIQLFLLITVWIPVLAALGYLALHANFFSRGYVSRDFSLTERLLTEPRILWDYLATSFVPRGSNMGIYHDNFDVSTGLLSPWTTITSIAAWAGMIAWAISWRRTRPIFAFGVLAYVVAHLLESGPIALELYFEHRNYLPSVFAILAICGLVHNFVANQNITNAFRTSGTTALVAVALIYGFSSWNHASAWSSEEEFHALQYQYNPTSPRLLSVLAGRAIVAKDLGKALEFIKEGELHSDASERATSTIWRFLAYCETNTPIPASLYDEFKMREHGRITNFTMIGWELLANRIMEGCDKLDTRRLTSSTADWLAASGQPQTAQPVWRTRYNLGRMLASTGDLRTAERFVRRAWLDSDYNDGVGVMLFQLNASLGNLKACREVLAYLERAADGQDKNLAAAIKVFREAIAKGEIVQNLNSEYSRK